MELEDICDDVAHLDLNEIESETGTCVVIDEENEMQVVKTKMRLCRIKDCEGCSNLHLCKLYLFGECPYNTKREECQFSHDLYSEHNIGVLCQHKLLELDFSELSLTLLQNDTTLLPSVCLAYNEGSGEFGNCLEAETCKNLHVCENYIRGICDGSTGCNRCHDLYEPHPLKTLQDNGVPNQLMDNLLSVYKSMLTIAHADRPSIDCSAIAPEKWWICLFHFQDSCNLEDACENVHFCLPYKWEQWDGHSWKVLPDNEEIERAYCDPTKTHSDSSVPVHFDTMTQGSVEVRRLSTISSVLDPSFALTTKWIWYWEDENGDWIQYGSSQGTHNTCSITSEFLECKYQENRSPIIKFTTDEHSYVVNVEDMIQYNTQISTEMRVRRRPMFLSAEDVQNIITREMELKDHLQNPQAFPCDSDKANMSVTGFKKVLLDSNTDEYKKIAECFYQTMSEFMVKSIEKVLNEDLWEVYQRHVSVMKQKNVGKENETLLFHGTESKHIDAICQQNMDWRICEAHETAYGKVISPEMPNPPTATLTSLERQCMFLCRVFIGEYTNGHPSYIHAPLKDVENGIYYDSCVNDINNPSIFVVFEKRQVYPEYLIQYEQRTGNSPQHVSFNQFSSSSQASFSDPCVSSQCSPHYFLPHFTPVVHSPYFAHSKKKYFQGGAPRLPFPLHYKPSLVRNFRISNPTRPPKRQSSHRGFGSTHLPENILAHARTSASVRKDTAKQLVSNSVRSANESRPMPLPTTLSTVTKESKSVKTQDGRQQTSNPTRPSGRLSPVNSSASVSSDTKTTKSVKAPNGKHQGSNSTKSNSGLSPGTTSLYVSVRLSTSTHTDASKSVTIENASGKRVSSLSTESTKPAGKSSRSSDTQSKKPAGKSSKSSYTQSTTSAGQSSRSSDTQSTKPAGKSSKSSASQSTTSAGKSSKSSASQSTTSAGKSSKSSASQSTKPAGKSFRSSTGRH